MYITKEYIILLVLKKEGQKKQPHSLSKWTYLKQKIFDLTKIHIKDTQEVLGTNFKITRLEIAPWQILKPRLESYATEDPCWGSRMSEKIMFYRLSSRQHFLRYVESFEKKRGTDYDG